MRQRRSLPANVPPAERCRPGDHAGRRHRLQVAVLGSGAAAFAGAIRAAEQGARVTMIEAGALGGTCVNVGCVPSKLLLRGAHAAHLQRAHPFAGLTRARPRVDRAGMVAQQQRLVAALRHARYGRVLDRHEGIELVRGFASFVDGRTLRVESPDGSWTLEGERFLIATGASPHIPAIPGLAGSPFWTSTEALVAEDVPQHLVVVGGSLVAVELGQAFLRLGAEVTLLARSTLVSREDPGLGEGLREALEGEGMAVWLHTVPSAVRHDGTAFRVETARGTVAGDRLLVATGRTPNTARLGLDRAGVTVDSRGAIVVDDHLRTSAPHIFAAGDCTTHPPWVYVAAAGGTHAAVNMTGGDAALDLATVPAVVFTDPQAAWVGLDETAARRQGLAVESRTLALERVPRAQVGLDTRGFVKLVAEAGSGRLLGAQILAAGGGEAIQTAAVAIRAGMTVHDLAGQLFPHLTMVEGLKLAAQSFRREVEELSCCAG